MIGSEQKRFDVLYAQHLRALKLHGYRASTIDVYAQPFQGVNILKLQRKQNLATRKR